jgi:Kdo2-lipid IVA lauroyltransferase/acyltransferase
MLSRFISQMGVVFMRLLARCPLPTVRALGWLLGWLLYGLAVPRRRVVQKNLSLCFPELSARRRQALARQTFVRFAQAWLDRSWLWHSSRAVLEQRLQLRPAGGARDLAALQGPQPTVIFAPHFVGMDAGWTALTLQLPRSFSTIYTDQANKVLDAWILQGRQRHGASQLYGRVAGVRSIVSGLKNGQALYLLPDMNFGPEESIFVPFFGIQAATVPSLSRFARLAGARVVPVLSRMTAQGYVVEVLPAWIDYPSADSVADTALMNRRLQDYIATMPDQYYWVHKRFKSRPPGEPGFY